MGPAAGRDPQSSGADAPRRSRGRRGQVRSPCGALNARGGVERAERGGSADSGLLGAAPDAAGTAGSRAAPGCRASRGGRARRGHWAGTKARSRETRRCEVAGAAPREGTPDYKSRTAGSGRGKRAPCRRGSMSWSAERAPPESSQLAAAKQSEEHWDPRRRLTRAGLCVRGGRQDPLCAQLRDPTGASVPAAESQRAERAVRAL